MNDTCNNSYEERTSALNVAEARFEFFCQGKNIWYCRMGFDETNGNVPLFYTLHPLIRSLPDYLIHFNDRLYYIHVKGTNKLKLADYELYREFAEKFCTPETPLYLAFCFEDTGDPIFKSLRWIIDVKRGLEIKTFANDGKEYIELPL